MADSKITALTAITTVNPATYPLVIVDTSDTSMAITGTTKKVTTNQLLGSGGTATLASATIIGDLTVKTNVLKVDTTNNRVGVNTASPATDLEVRANGNAEGTIRLYSAIDGSTASPKGSYFSFRSGTTAGGTETARLSSLNRFANVLGGDFSISTADTSSVLQNRLTIDSGGVFTFAVGGSTAMTLNSTGLGVGYSPSGSADKLGSAATLGVVATGATADLNFRNSSLTSIQRIRYTDGTGVLTIGSASTVSYQVELGGNTTTRAVTIDASSNVGIGVTPSGTIYSVSETRLVVKGTSNNFAGTLAVQSKGTTNAVTGFLTASDNTNEVGVGSTTNSPLNFYTNNALKATIDASGNLILLSSNTPATLATNGQLTVNATSNTNLRFSYRGSDGVTRVANITLA